MKRPPDWLVQDAVKVAMQSPCAKSKRGVIAFIEQEGGISVQSQGFNGPPANFPCDGDNACRESCAKLCVHAEQRAIREALLAAHEGSGARNTIATIDLIHVKAVGGRLIAGGPPSCWQCSRELLDVGFNGIWLYEDHGAESYGGFEVPDHRWAHYSAREFHQATLQNCGITKAGS